MDDKETSGFQYTSNSIHLEAKQAFILSIMMIMKIMKNDDADNNGEEYINDWWRMRQFLIITVGIKVKLIKNTIATQQS